MLARINLARILGLLGVVSLILGWIAVAPVAGADLVPPAQETPPAEEPPPTPVHLPATPGESESVVLEPAPPEEGGLGR